MEKIKLLLILLAIMFLKIGSSYSQETNDSIRKMEISKFANRNIKDLLAYLSANNVYTYDCNPILHKHPYCNGVKFSIDNDDYIIWFEKDRKRVPIEIISDVNENCLESKYIRDRKIVEIVILPR